MIHGVGTDIVDIARLQALWQRHGARALDKFLAPTERADCVNSPDPGRYLAKRFAAKEAFSKAMGTGIHFPVNWHNVSVANERSGKPYLKFSEPLAALLKQRGISRAHLSLSDEIEMACAFVILEGEDRG